MKVSSERCLSLLGFSPETCVSTHQTLGSSVQVVVPTPDDQNAGAAMSALIHALYETKNVGVARYVARKNAAPRLVALLPQIKASHEVIITGDDVMMNYVLVTVSANVTSAVHGGYSPVHFPPSLWT
jgi:hypothetical protein